jgi:hypothetical protein
VGRPIHSLLQLAQALKSWLLVAVRVVGAVLVAHLFLDSSLVVEVAEMVAMLIQLLL